MVPFLLLKATTSTAVRLSAVGVSQSDAFYGGLFVAQLNFRANALELLGRGARKYPNRMKAADARSVMTVALSAVPPLTLLPCYCCGSCVFFGGLSLVVPVAVVAHSWYLDDCELLLSQMRVQPRAQS